MRAIRGLYVVRSGVAVPRLAQRQDGEGGGEGDQAPDDGRLATLEVDFSRFDAWYEIDSIFEGRFMERVRPGAFKRTIDQRGDQLRVFFNHGFELSIGRQVLSVPEVLEERDDGPHLEGPLFDTSFNRDLLPGLRAGAYGSSFMFEVLGEEWREEPGRSEDNPDGLPERSITEVRLFEAGPVTWPANPAATAGVRSGTDWLAERVAEFDTDQYERMARSFEAFRDLHGLRTSPDGEPATPVDPTPTTPAPGVEPARHVDGITAAARRRRLELIDMGR